MVGNIDNDSDLLHVTLIHSYCVAKFFFFFFPLTFKLWYSTKHLFRLHSLTFQLTWTITIPQWILICFCFLSVFFFVLHNIFLCYWNNQNDHCWCYSICAVFVRIFIERNLYLKKDDTSIEAVNWRMKNI